MRSERKVGCLAFCWFCKVARELQVKEKASVRPERTFYCGFRNTSLSSLVCLNNLERVARQSWVVPFCFSTFLPPPRRYKLDIRNSEERVRRVALKPCLQMSCWTEGVLACCKIASFKVQPLWDGVFPSLCDRRTIYVNGNSILIYLSLEQACFQVAEGLLPDWAKALKQIAGLAATTWSHRGL